MFFYNQYEHAQVIAASRREMLQALIVDSRLDYETHATKLNDTRIYICIHCHDFKQVANLRKSEIKWNLFKQIYICINYHPTSKEVANILKESKNNILTIEY